MRSHPSSRLQASILALKSYLTPSSTQTASSEIPSRQIGSTALDRLKSFIHPPLPLTPRESQRLLNEITGSFRRQLAVSSTLPVLNSETSEKTPVIQLERLPNGSRIPGHDVNPANIHLGKLLQKNQLKGWQPEVMDPIHTEGTGNHETRIKRILSQPLEVFEEHIWSGTASSTLTAFCLRTYVNQVLAALNSTDTINAAIAPKPDGALMIIHLLRSSQLIPKVGPPPNDRNLCNWLVAGLLLSSKPSIPFSWVIYSLKHKNFTQAGELLWAVVQAYLKIYDEKRAVDLFLHIIGYKQEPLRDSRISRRISAKTVRALQFELIDSTSPLKSNILYQLARKIYERVSSDSLRKELVGAIHIWNPHDTGLTVYLMLKHFHDPYPGLDFLLSDAGKDISYQKEQTILGLQIVKEFYRREQPELAGEAMRIVHERSGMKDQPYVPMPIYSEEKKHLLKSSLENLMKNSSMENLWNNDGEDLREVSF